MSSPIGSSQATAITTAGPTPIAANTPVIMGKPTTVLMAAMPCAMSCSEPSSFKRRIDLSWFMILATYSTMASVDPGIATPSRPGIVISATSAVVSIPASIITALRSSLLVVVEGVTGSKSGSTGKGKVGNGFLVVVVLMCWVFDITDRVGLKVANTAGFIVGL